MSQVPNTRQRLTPQETFNRIVAGQTYNPFLTGARIRTKRYWHRQAYAAAGALSFTFFNVPNQRFVTNMPTAGALPAGYNFAAVALGLRVVQGVDIAGTPVAAGAAFSATGVAPATIAEQLRLINAQGLVTMTVNGITEVDDWGIDAFPTGRGMDGATALATTASGAASFSNGVPHVSNRREFGPLPLAIPQNANFSLTIEFQTLLPLTGGGVIEAYLDGFLVTPVTSGG